MRNFLEKVLSLGVYKNQTKNETKLIKLLNFFCIIWYSTSIIFTCTDYFFEELYQQAISGYAIQIILILIIQILQDKQKYNAARYLFIFTTFLQFFVFSNFIATGNLIELFYILTPLFSLILFNNKRIHYSF